MGMKVAAADMKSLANDRTETYLKCLRETVNDQLQIVVMIMPTPRDDRYSAVKMLCNVEQPVPSQVINYKTPANEKKAFSMVQKVALQVNCKEQSVVGMSAQPQVPEPPDCRDGRPPRPLQARQQHHRRGVQQQPVHVSVVISDCLPDSEQSQRTV